jgi:hypothetical protein
MTKEKCPDQIVGEFINYKLIGENQKENRKEITKTYLAEKPRIMCIILESPHIDEYDKYGKAIGPAKEVCKDCLNKRNIRIIMPLG